MYLKTKNREKHFDGKILSRYFKKVINIKEQFFFLDYQLQFIKSYQFWNQMKKDATKVFIDEIYSSPPKHNYPTNNTIIKSIDDTWSSDLLDMIDYGV